MKTSNVLLILFFLFFSIIVHAQKSLKLNFSLLNSENSYYDNKYNCQLSPLSEIGLAYQFNLKFEFHVNYSHSSFHHIVPKFESWWDLDIKENQIELGLYYNLIEKEKFRLGVISLLGLSELKYEANYFSVNGPEIRPKIDKSNEISFRWLFRSEYELFHNFGLFSDFSIGQYWLKSGPNFYDSEGNYMIFNIIDNFGFFVKLK